MAKDRVAAKSHGVIVAADIYERQALAEQGASGDVYTDIADLSYDDMADYFGDLDPIAFL